MRAGVPSTGISRKYDRLLGVVADHPGYVAFSGGVDSTLLLRAVCEVALRQAVALFADSFLQSQVDRENARSLAVLLGVRLQTVAIDPLLWPDFLANSPTRCYLCKDSVYRRFQELLPKGMALLDGTNYDDLAAHRPGQVAIDELGVLSPLALAGLGKTEVREMARRLDLPNWHRPSASCLATRIPVGFAISPELVRHIEECEDLVRLQGFGHIRLRLNQGLSEDVTVELAEEEMADPGFSRIADCLTEGLRGLGVVRMRFVGRKGVFCARHQAVAGAGATAAFSG